MYEQVEKPKEKRSSSVTNFAVQKKKIKQQSLRFVDNRAKHNPKKNSVSNEDGLTQLMDTKAHCINTWNVMQRGKVGQAHNSRRTPVQRLKAADGTAEEGKDAPYTLNADFILKHVANSLTGAEIVTEARIATNKPKGMVEGTAANHVATQDVWEAAINGSNVKVPPEGEWNYENGDATGRENRLVWVEVDGWEAIGTKGNVKGKAMKIKKFLGGDWSVANTAEDGDGYSLTKTGNVTMDFNHLTS